MIRTKEIMAESLTVIAAFLRLQGKNKCILESTPREEDQRFSIITWDPVEKITYHAGIFTVGDHQFPCQDPLKELEKYVIKNERVTQLPFNGGAIGYTSYDLAAVYESLGPVPSDSTDVPELQFYLIESFLIFDHHSEKITLVETNMYSQRSITEMDEALRIAEQQLQQIAPDEFSPYQVPSLSFSSSITKEQFENNVRKAQEKIVAGDLFQIVLSQRWTAEFHGATFPYYRRLRLLNPSAYMYYFDFDDLKIIGSSPESLVQVRGSQVITNPIAGTRPRGRSPLEDEQLAKELLEDEKERAEHQMLVDLGRNDVGRISEVGSVHVPVYMTIEKFRFVMHIVSVVEGVLEKGNSAMDALKATLPAGTVSGAPKIRAMQEIYQLEQQKRSIYAGAVGYFSQDGQADFAIAIRTFVMIKDQLFVQSGAGIVYDSDPTKEYEETLHKVKALMEVCK